MIPFDVNVQAQSDDYGLGATLSFSADDDSNDITALWRECVGSWRRIVEEE